MGLQEQSLATSERSDTQSMGKKIRVYGYCVIWGFMVHCPQIGSINLTILTRMIFDSGMSFFVVCPIALPPLNSQ